MLHKLQTEGLRTALSSTFDIDAADVTIDLKTGKPHDTSGQIDALIGKHPAMQQVYGKGKNHSSHKGCASL